MPPMNQAWGSPSLAFDSQDVWRRLCRVNSSRRTGAWDKPDFVKAIEATGRKTLIKSGDWTSMCVTFPALQAQADSYKVYLVTDDWSDPSELVSHTTIARLTHAGIIAVAGRTICSCRLSLRLTNSFRQS